MRGRLDVVTGGPHPHLNPLPSRERGSLRTPPVRGNDIPNVNLFASYLTRKVAVGPSHISGKGIIAVQAIASGELVAVWGGHLITREDMQQLPPEVREHPVQVWHDLFVGPRTAAEMEPVDYMNHSCEPSCGVKGQIIVLARRDIAPGEELTFDYATTDTIGLDVECHCGAPSCRGRVTSDDWKDPAFQARNAGYMSLYIQEMIDEYQTMIASPLSPSGRERE
ncbi:MAG: SET domain-containing protein-lysine N-methyltransferase [Chloroflexi bacterium]|nr:SET domain-containing protein-lysine N-methyltransferase [Chloroflexota bacterium]